MTSPHYHRYKKFFFQALILSGLGCVCFLLFVYYLARPNEWNWINDMYKIKENIASNIPGNKIVFGGGSNALFGVRTEDIEKELNIPTVNFGVMAGLQIDYILDRVKRILKPGDVVIVPLEYSQLLYNGNLDEVRTIFILMFDKNYFHSLPFFEKIKYFVNISPRTVTLSILSIIRKIQGNKKSFSAYETHSLNKNGDDLSNIGNDWVKKKYDSILPVDIQKGDLKETIGLKKINEFNLWCNKNNINFFVSYATTIYFDAYLNTEYQEYFNKIQSYFKEHNIKTIGYPSDFFYDKDLFYDTIYHLNSFGATYHTKRLLPKIKEILRN
jgi:hypothetical protein